MPIGIALVAGQLGLGGAEQQLYYLVSGLDRSRFHPIVVTLGPEPNEYWEQRMRELSISVHHIPHMNRALRAFRVAELLRVQKVEIVHGWMFHTNPYCAVAGRLANVSIRLGSMREAYSGLPNGTLLRWMGYRGLDILITNSTDTAQQVERRHVTRARIQIVPNGVTIPKQITPTERERLRSELGCSNTDLLIGTIGRLDENKNHSMLLRVLALSVKKWPALRLVIIGNGPVKSKLLTMTENLGVTSKVNFPGNIPLAAKYLPAMDVCCLTSYSEGMPNVIMEAAAAGLPVVATNCGDAGILVDHNVSGYLVEPDDDTAMSAYLNALLAERERRFCMGEAGRQKMRREFSIDSMILRMSCVYEEALLSKGLV